MKKLITLLLVLAGMVSTASATETMWLRSGGLKNGSWSANLDAYQFTGNWDGSQDVYELIIGSDKLQDDTDFFFRLFRNGTNFETCPYNNQNYTFGWLGADNTFNGRWEQYAATSGPSFQGTSGAFKVEHSKLKANEYKITVYLKYNNPWEYYIKVEIIDMPVSVGAKGFATYCNSNCALDFTDKSIKAYTISSTDGSALTLTQKDKVAKNEPVLLYSETNSDQQNIPVIVSSEATATEGNKLVAGDGEEHTWSSSTEHYILYTGGTTPGFYRANNSPVAVGKAYLDLTGLPAPARSFDLNMEDEVITGINAVENSNVSNAIYNLNGQRVAQPAKGLYIMNGKKVIIK